MAIVCPRRASSCVVAAALAVYVVLGCSAGVDAVAIRATWPQPFQNTRNTGESVVSGPVGPGSCPNDLLPDSVNKAQYFHTGVLSLDNQRLYVGSSLNVVYMIDVATSDFVTVDLGPGNREKGVVASPVVAPYGPTLPSGARNERVYVASADSFVYGLDPVACMNVTSQEGCIVWSTNLSQPVLAPMHHTMHGIDDTQHTNGVLYASTTSLVSDTDARGVLYALDVNLGVIIAHVASTSVDGAITYPIHSAVTLVNCPMSPFLGMIFMPFGPRIVALLPVDLTVVAELPVNFTIANDPFQSSLAMAGDCRTMFVQSRSRRVWKLNITGNSVADMSLELMWRCQYTPTESNCCVGQWCQDPANAVYDVPALPDLGDPTVTNVFSTPALNPVNNEFVVGLTDPYLPSPDIKGGIYSADQDTGYCIKRLTEYESLNIGSVRSSAAIDPNGRVYIGSDTASGDQTEPVLYALDQHLEVEFITSLAEPGILMGGASPLLTTNVVNGEVVSFVVISGGNKIRSFKQGMQCPSISNNPLEVCSGNGVCNCNTGECKCNSACYIDDRCSVEMSCGGHGNCFEGICNCHVCYSPPDCAGDNVCSSHGTCAEDGDTAQCHCQGCYGGFNCEIEETCNGNGACVTEAGGGFSCHCFSGYKGDRCETPTTGGGGDGGAVITVVVIVLLMMLGVGVWLMYQWRTGKGLFRPKKRLMRRSKRTLDVIYESEEEHDDSAPATKSYGTSGYTTL